VILAMLCSILQIEIFEDQEKYQKSV